MDEKKKFVWVVLTEQTYKGEVLDTEVSVYDDFKSAEKSYKEFVEDEKTSLYDTYDGLLESCECKTKDNSVIEWEIWDVNDFNYTQTIASILRKEVK